jgi:hypothetical protein
VAKKMGFLYENNDVTGTATNFWRTAGDEHVAKERVKNVD